MNIKEKKKNKLSMRIPYIGLEIPRTKFKGKNESQNSLNNMHLIQFGLRGSKWEGGGII